MAPSAAAKKLEEPVILEKNRTGIRGVLIGPPGSGKGTQVTIHNLLYRNKAIKLKATLYGKQLWYSCELLLGTTIKTLFRCLPSSNG